ncbi:MAG TPA: hypothetical protein VHO69_04185 [Phototrophicaceae bacterium]|nr:hypothetical protein [Phototrophicaceae bacterium]
MPSGFEITCANKNYGGLIVRVGGDGWSLDNGEAISQILLKQLRLYIRVDAQFVDVGVRGDGQNTYLALEPDGFPLHDLTDLTSC